MHDIIASNWSTNKNPRKKHGKSYQKIQRSMKNCQEEGEQMLK